MVCKADEASAKGCMTASSGLIETVTVTVTGTVTVTVTVVVVVVVVVVVGGAPPPYQLCWLIFPLPELWGEGGGGG